MVYGMTYDQFWHGDPYMAKSYKRAYEIRMDADNSRAWLQGAYFYHALCAASPLFRLSMEKKVEPLPYLDEPFSLKKEVQDDKPQLTKDELNAINFMKQFAKAHNKKLEESNG